MLLLFNYLLHCHVLCTLVYLIPFVVFLPYMACCLVTILTFSDKLFNSLITPLAGLLLTGGSNYASLKGCWLVRERTFFGSAVRIKEGGCRGRACPRCLYLRIFVAPANDYLFQFGFRDFDGMGACASLTDFLIKYARNSCKHLHMAFVDLQKSFDSVYHTYLWKARLKKSLPVSFVKYLIEFYDSFGTFLVWKGRLINFLFPGRGVRQGDPLSSILFNIVIESIFEQLDPNIGFDLPDLRVSHIAYADDVNLVSATNIGLQLLLQKFKALAQRAGLIINIRKTKVLALKAYGGMNKELPGW